MDVILLAGIIKFIPLCIPLPPKKVDENSKKEDNVAPFGEHK